jgi:hypothetical protein
MIDGLIPVLFVVVLVFLVIQLSRYSGGRKRR